jgi:hypothetical protein
MDWNKVAVHLNGEAWKEFERASTSLAPDSLK